MSLSRFAAVLGYLSLVIASSLVCEFATAAEPAPEKTFRAGAYAQNINPQTFPMSSNGNMSDKQATKITDDLHARCLVLDDGRTKLAIVVVDSCMIMRREFDEAKRMATEATGIPTDKILISATHTHTGVTAAGVFQSEPDPSYLPYLSAQIAKGIKAAHDSLQPAEIGFGVGKNDRQVFNRRWYLKPGTMPVNPFGTTVDKVKMNPGRANPNLVKPAGPIDPDVSIVSVRTAGGRPLALLANYSLHYVGGREAFSADYFGEFAKRIGELLQADGAGADTKLEGSKRPTFVGIMSNGTSGDINNVDFRKPGARQAPGEQLKIVADDVAQTALEVYKKIEHKKWLPLAMAEREIELGVRIPSKEDLAVAEAALAKAGPGPYKAISDIYARETTLLAKYDPTVKVKLQAIRLGDLAITSTPCETFVEIGLALKKAHRSGPLFTIELANGYNGYLPTPEQMDLGGYETWRARSSYLERDAATKITATLVELLGELSK
jgi:neutral ceramidase